MALTNVIAGRGSGVSRGRARARRRPKMRRALYAQVAAQPGQGDDAKLSYAAWLAVHRRLAAASDVEINHDL